MGAPNKTPIAALPECVELVDGRKVPLRVVVNPRARRIALRVDAATQEAVAVAPNLRLAASAAAFAIHRAGWIAAQLSRLPEPVLLCEGAVVPLRGTPHRLERAPGRGIGRVEAGPPARIVVSAPDPALFAARVKRVLAAEARADFEAAVARHAATLGATWSRIAVKDTTSRWGSCSYDGGLSFSWRVVMAPPFVLDYLAAHEVAHLRELNHSRRFWKLVAQCTPHVDEAESWLRRHGAALHAIGPRSA